MSTGHPAGSRPGHLHPIEDVKRLAHQFATNLDRMHNAEGVDHDGSTHVGSNIVLNAAFVEEVGPRAAEEFRAVLEGAGRLTHHRRGEIRTVLTARLAELGLTIHPVVLDRFVDEVSRSDWVRLQADR